MEHSKTKFHPLEHTVYRRTFYLWVVVLVLVGPSVGFLAAGLLYGTVSGRLEAVGQNLQAISSWVRLHAGAGHNLHHSLCTAAPLPQRPPGAAAHPSCARLCDLHRRAAPWMRCDDPDPLLGLQPCEDLQSRLSVQFAMGL